MCCDLAEMLMAEAGEAWSHVLRSSKQDGLASPTSPAHLAVDCEFYKKKSDKLTEENDNMRESGPFEDANRNRRRH